MYDVTLRRVRVTVIAVEKQKYYILPRARVRACVRACVCRMDVGARARGYAFARVALFIQHAKLICGLSGSTIFFDIIS
jgi:hypothetical protein